MQSAGKSGVIPPAAESVEPAICCTSHARVAHRYRIATAKKVAALSKEKVLRGIQVTAEQQPF